MTTQRTARGGWCDPATLPKGANGRALCRECSTEVPVGRRTFCSADCVERWKLRTNPAFVRQRTYERDGGVCAACGAETMQHMRQRTGQRWRGHWRGTGHLWQADHILPVAEGGGQCGLDNIRTLCTACHRAATNALMGRLRGKR
jgi:5-methylcytosine-specific restriction endonuclease McrA